MPNLNVISGSGTKSSKKAEPLSVAKLRAILEDEGMRHRQPKETFEAFEERVHRQLQEVERELLGRRSGTRGNDDRRGFEEILREGMTVPDEAVTVMASLDGVLAPMKDGGGRGEARRDGGARPDRQGTGGVPGGGLRDAVLL